MVRTKVLTVVLVTGHPRVGGPPGVHVKVHPGARGHPGVRGLEKCEGWPMGNLWLWPWVTFDIDPWVTFDPKGRLTFDPLATFDLELLVTFVLDIWSTFNLDPWMTPNPWVARNCQNYRDRYTRVLSHVSFCISRIVKWDPKEIVACKWNIFILHVWNFS